MKRNHLVNLIANYIYESGVDAEDADELGEEIFTKLESMLKLEIDENSEEYKILKVNGQKICGCKGE